MGIAVDDEGRAATSSVPDVSVILAVYNTMPYLTKCLTSLVGQSIGRKRLEIIAVDDGSTDGSSNELDRFARRYPGTLTVIRQPNSGGPAAPSNRGLERATGRYVFFVGADDYLGREALERLVVAADEYSADVVAGRMVGDNGRYVPLAIFARTNYDVDLFNSPLPFAISNTKLFRRELLERHGVRYSEDLLFGSDQPFTIAACVYAKRIAVLADYDYYYAVRRRNRGNITYRSKPERRLRCTEEIMAKTAALLGPGPERDAIMHRSFASELSKLTRSSFLKLDRATQEQVSAGIGRLVDLYLTDAIRDRLDASRRVRLLVAQHGYVDDLIAVVAQNAGPRHPPLVVDGGRLYMAYDCFRDARMLPDEWFLVTADPREVIARQLDVRAVSWRTRWFGRSVLAFTAAGPAVAADSQPDSIGIVAGQATGQVSFEMGDGHEGAVVQAEFTLSQLMAGCPRLGGRWDFVVRVTLSGATTEAPIRLPKHVKRPYRIGRAGLRFYIVRPEAQPDREFAIDFAPLTMRLVVRKLRKQLAFAKRLRMPGRRRSSTA